VSRGFTLVEILVVVVIIGVLATALVLRVDIAGGARQVEHEAEQARALIGYACEQAELRGREIGVSMSTSGYRFSQLEQDAWLPFGEGELRTRSWLPNSAIGLSRDGHAVALAGDYPDVPQLLCYSSGELTAFELDLGLPEVNPHYRVEGHPDGTLALRSVDAHAH